MSRGTMPATSWSSTVADSGQGIGADFLPYVFDRFRQADASASRRHGGLGSGLALMRKSSSSMAGAIEVESDGVDRGSRFSIRLPISDAPLLPVPKVTTSSTADVLKGISILLVDDSQDGREMLEFALRSYGAEVMTASSCEAALSALTNELFAPDVIVSDIGMPGGDGYSFIRQVQELSRLPRNAGDRVDRVCRTRRSDSRPCCRLPLAFTKANRSVAGCRSIRDLVAADRALKEPGSQS